MIEIIGERRVNLRQRQVRVLKMNFLRTVAMRQMLQDNFDDFDVSVVDPRDAFGVETNVSDRFCRNHAASLNHAELTDKLPDRHLHS